MTERNKWILLIDDVWESVYSLLREPLDRKRLSLTSPALRYLTPANIPCTVCDTSKSAEVLVLNEEVERGIQHSVAYVTVCQPFCSPLSCLANVHQLHLYIHNTNQQRLQDWPKVLAVLRTYVAELHLLSHFEPGQIQPQISLYGLERFSKLRRLDVCAYGDSVRDETLHQLRVCHLTGFQKLQVLTELNLYYVVLKRTLCLPPCLQTLSMQFCTSEHKVMAAPASQLKTVCLKRNTSLVGLPPSVESLTVEMMGCNSQEGNIWNSLPNLKHLDLIDERTGNHKGEKRMERHWTQFDRRPAVSAAMLQEFMAVPNHSGCWTWKVRANPDGVLKDPEDKALVDLFDQHGFKCSMWPADSYVLGYGYTSFEVSYTSSSDPGSAN